VLQDWSELTEEEAAENQIAQSNEPMGRYWRIFCRCGDLLVARADEVLVVREKRCEQQCGFLGQDSGDIEDGNESLAAKLKTGTTDIDEESGDKEKCGFEIGHPAIQATDSVWMG